MLDLEYLFPNIPNTTFVGYSLKDILNPFMKEINIPNTTFVVYSLKDILNLFMNLTPNTPLIHTLHT